MSFPDKFDMFSGKRRYFRYSVEDRCMSSEKFNRQFYHGHLLQNWDSNS